MARLFLLAMVLLFTARLVLPGMGSEGTPLGDDQSSGTNYSCMKWEQAGQGKIYYRCSQWFGKDTHSDVVVSSRRSSDISTPGGYVVAVQGSH